ncbi:hypothetical protein NPIL_61971 [Nephila pilipes]|uniref:Uncharacterized protein n=1 Tax=Nephila pilipes TaxID=299642 RepID=A0A8X6MPC4_NEPPI|nr:hypothetical protein NPIL_61971 [Nephila pilipes]
MGKNTIEYGHESKSWNPNHFRISDFGNFRQEIFSHQDIFQEDDRISTLKIDDIEYGFSSITRNLLLQTIITCNVPQRIVAFLEAMEGDEFLIVYDSSVHLMQSFYQDFENMTELYKEDFIESPEIEYAECLLSKCVALCGEPTYFKFMLVASFLSDLVIKIFNYCGCFRILYITEFCFDVLYRRVFRKIFKSQEDYEKLLSFCNEFNEHMEPDPTVGNLCYIFHGKNLTKQVGITNFADNSFSLKKSERELFKRFYSKESLLPMPSDLEEEILDTLKSEQNCYHHGSNCDSKCYSYLDYVDQYL